MTQVDRRVIESNLLSKGFKQDERDHRFYYFYHNAKRTKIRTKISTGSGYKTYGDDLLCKMRDQLKLNTKRQAIHLLTCPMTEEEYIELLNDKHII